MSSVPAWKALETQALEARARNDHTAALAAFRELAVQLPEPGWVQVQVGTEHRSLGDMTAAEEAFNEALRLEPENIHARNGLAQIARARGDREAALAHFQEITGLAPETHWAWTEAAADLLALGRQDEAQATYETILAKAPTNVHALLGLGKLVRAANRLEEALALFISANQASPDSFWPSLEYAHTLLELRRIDEAEHAYERLIGKNEAYLAEIGLGRCARARGDRAGAQVRFARACALATHILWPWLTLANEQCDQGDFDAARATAQEGLKHHPNATLLWRALGEIELRRGNLEASQQVLQTALENTPGDAGLLVDLARLEGQIGHLDEADEFIVRALSLDPCHIGALALRADFAQQRGSIGEARASYAKALKLQPNNPTLRIGGLTVQGVSGEAHKALAGFAALAVEGYASPELYLAWSRMAREAGHTAGILRLMQEATAKFPDNFWLAVERAQAVLVTGQYQYHAELRFLQSVGTRSLAQQALRQFFLGALAERTGQTDVAIRYYEAAVRANPQDIAPHMALARTKLLRLNVDQARHHLVRVNQINPGNVLRRGGSLNVSQTHIGQLLDEYTLDRDLLCDMRAISNFVPAHRAEAMRLLVMRHPDNVAVAATLMLALREAGRLDHVRQSDERAAIPRVIGQFWDEESPPADVALLMASWVEENPDHVVQRFSFHSAAAFLREHYPEELLRAFVRAMEPAKRADLFRLAWLYKSGGIYVDADDRCIAPVSTLLPRGADMVLYQEEYATFGNNFVAAAPGNPIILRALQQAVICISRGDADIIWLSTGPGLLTRAVAQQICVQGAAVLPPGLAVLQRHELHQAIAPHCKANYKKTPQHWTNSAFNAKLLRNNRAGGTESALKM